MANAVAASNIHSRVAFEYSPIPDDDGIRLIQLQPSEDTAAMVNCSLVNVSLARFKEDIIDHYTAVSYVWGDSTDTVEINVDGKHLFVTRTLDSALRHIRDSLRQHLVWADAICINQHDVQEKNKQVKRMGSIYATASHTVLYLGDPDWASNKVFGSDSDVAEISDDVGQNTSILEEFLSRPWFHRVWTLQEFVLSRDSRIQVGHQRMRWQDFCAVIQELPGWGLTLASQSKNVAVFLGLNSIRDSHRDEYGNALTDLLEVLRSRRGLGVSDARDMIFGHLGIISEDIIQVDYAMTVKELFEQFAKYHIEKTKGLDILGYLEDLDLDNRNHDFGSWTPDWTTKVKQPEELSPSLLHLRDSYATLRKGTAVDRDLDTKPSPFWTSQECQSSFPRAHTWLAKPSLFCTNGYVTHTVVDLTDGPPIPYKRSLPMRGIRLSDAVDFWRQSLVLKNYTMPSIEDLFPKLEERNRLLGNTKQDNILGGNFTLAHNQWILYVYIELGRRRNTAVEGVTAGRLIASLNNGTLALVPINTRVGDEICVFEYWPMPLIVRENSSEENGKLDSAIRIAASIGPKDSMGRASRSLMDPTEKIEHYRIVGVCVADDLLLDNTWKEIMKKRLGERRILAIH